MGLFYWKGIFMKKYDLKKITVTAVFCAVAYICMFVFRFKVSFLTFDFKDAVIAVVSFMFGPLYGVVTAGTVALLELFTVSDTGFYGFVMNLCSSAVFGLTCGTIYKYKKTFSGAIFAASAAVITVTCAMMLANILVTPFYMGVKTETVVNMIPTLLLPFNLCKATMNAAVTLIIYKPITTGLKNTGLIESKSKEKFKLTKKTIWLTLGALMIAVFTAFILIYSLGGSFEFIRR